MGLPPKSKKVDQEAPASSGGPSADELRALVRRLIEQQELERLWVARELHDVLGQSFTLLKLMLDTIKADNASLIDDALAVIDEAAAGVRRVSRRMRPSTLDLSLSQALDWLISTFEKDKSVRVTLRSRGLKDNLPPELNTAVYRIVQEALELMARRGGEKEAEVEISVKGRVLSLAVTDTGAGLDFAAPAHSISLIFMKERAAMVGGKLEVNPRSGKGAMLAATFPIPAFLTELKPLC